MRAATLFLLALCGACGGEGIEAPRVLAPDADTGCPSTEEAVDDTKAAMRDGLFDPIRPVVEEVWRDGGLTVLFRAVLVAIPAAGLDDLLTVTEGALEPQGIGAIRPHLVRVLQYVVGESEFVAGAHYEPIAALHDVLIGCDVAKNASAARQLLELTVAGADGAQVPWVEETVRAVVDVASDPGFQDLLDRIELDDDEAQGGIRVGRDAFVLLARLVVANIASPDFDATYVRDLIEDVLLDQVELDDEVLRAKISVLLDLLQLIVEQDAVIFPAVQDLFGCAERHDQQGRFAGMLYDYLSIEALEYTEFLDDVWGAGGSTAADALREGVVKALRALESEPRITVDAARVLSELLSPERREIVVPFVLSLQGKGVATEVGEFLRLGVAGPCRSDDG
jgi:hypothetical protein